jgi:DNA-binding transcriptional LysR family regulator
MFSQGQLRYFVVVSEEGQITRAARRLQLAQPALSQAIAQLEGQLGVELFVRHPRGVTLTDAGAVFLVKARAALAAEAETAQTAMALRRAANATITVGFIGPPPAISVPALFAAFSERNAHAEISFQDLPFPCGATSSWIANVDIALLHQPTPERGVSMQPVRVEPRAVVLSRAHALAASSELELADVLDEPFISYHPDVPLAWAGFHSLDDHRGGPPTQLTHNYALTSLQMLGIMSAPPRAITTLPCLDAKLAQQVLPGIAAIPLRDAEPTKVSLVWRSDTCNPLVAELVEAARELSVNGNEL